MDELAAEIRGGSRPPGSRLPSVAEQTAAGISQTTTLRAYRELVAQGLATTVHGSGTFVAHVVPNAEPTLEDRVRALEEQRRSLEERVRALETR